MKAKNSLCMNRIRYILVVCIMLCCSATLPARTFERVSGNNPWNSSSNVAGVRMDSVSVSYAEIHGSYTGGGFRDTWQPEQSWSAGAVTQSIRHLEKMSLTGAFSFDQKENYGMCGSMFINPGYFPIDVLEFTPGRKTLQTYGLEGGIAYPADETWTVGVKMEFGASNLAKRKDLRHTNWKLDMSLAPGFTAKAGNFVLGAAGIFEKHSESIDAEQVGTTESSYHAFLDKGLMFGVEQIWTGGGIHLDETGVKGLPVSELAYGGALQLQYKNIFAEFGYVMTDGHVGEKEYIWFDYSGPGMKADIRYSLNRKKAEHRFMLHWDLACQNMDENILETVSGNGVTNVVGHGSNRIYSREMWSISPEYEYISKYLEIRAAATMTKDNGISSQMYPYVATRSVTLYSADVTAMLHIGKADIEASVRYASGDTSESMRSISEETRATSPFRLRDWYDRHMEYRTARRTETGLMFRYNFRKGIYIKASGRWTHGIGVNLLDGSDRMSATIGVGYNF